MDPGLEGNGLPTHAVPLGNDSLGRSLFDSGVSVSVAFADSGAKDLERWLVPHSVLGRPGDTSLAPFWAYFQGHLAAERGGAIQFVKSQILLSKTWFLGKIHGEVIISTKPVVMVVGTNPKAQELRALSIITVTILKVSPVDGPLHDL